MFVNTWAALTIIIVWTDDERRCATHVSNVSCLK